MKFDDVYIVDAGQPETEFIRRAYINLARNSYSPNVLKGTFGPVESGVMQVTGTKAHVDTSYKYDRIIYVTGTVMTTERQRYGRSYRDVQVPKQAQLPQHIPETGRTSGDVEGCVLNLKSFTEVDNPASYLFYLNYNIPDMQRCTKRRPDKDFPNLTLTDEAYERSTRTACDIVNSMAALPDEYDNISFDPTYYVKQVTCYIVPFYSATYTLGSKTYAAKGFACGDPNVWNECPAGINNVSIDQEAEKKSGVKIVQYLFPVLTWAMYILAIVLSICIGVSVFWTFVLSFGLYLIGLIAYMVACSRFNSYADSMQPRWASTMTQALNVLFATLSMEPLSSKETLEFTSVDFKSMKQAPKRTFHTIRNYSLCALIVQIISLLVVLFVAASILA
ncbi:MAG: hypothetical protein LUE27_04195 [Clostridia bacterium]|nr:hypothetical protein [Clostridia bacterium]